MLVIPLAGTFFGIFTPMPTVLFLYRWGSPLGFWVPGIAALVGLLALSLLSMVEAAPFFVGLLGVGLVMGWGMRSRWSVEKTVALAGIFLFGLGTVAFWLISMEIEGGLVRHMEESLGQTISAVLQQYAASSPETRILEQSLLDFVPTAVRLMPGVAASSILVVCWLNLFVALRYCRLHGLPMPLWERWTAWKAPEMLVWGVIAAGFMILLPVRSLSLLGMNVSMVLGTVYLFQGLAVTSHYFERWRLPRILRAVLYGFFLLQMPATLGMILLGLADVWIDFRRFPRKPSATSP